MATPVGTQDSRLTREPLTDAFAGVIERIRKEPHTFHFFQLVRILEQVSGRGRVGGFGDPRGEPVRFSAHSSLAFPASEIQEIDWRETIPRVVVNFMGLTGPCGVLPHVYTELVEERQRARDTALRDFFDLFNHRLISLFYRAWKKYRFAIQGESGLERFSVYLGSLVGLGTPGLERRQAVPDSTLVYYAGLLSLQPRSAVALRQLLIDYFNVPVEIDQFRGTWRKLSTQDTCTFQDRRLPSEQLGRGAVIGEAVWDQESVVRITLGPLPEALYRDFLPGGSGHRRLRAMARFFALDQIDFEVRLVLRREDVSGCSLGAAGTGVQLGWTTWVKSRQAFDHDPGDTVLALSEREFDAG